MLSKLKIHLKLQDKKVAKLLLHAHRVGKIELLKSNTYSKKDQKLYYYYFNLLYWHIYIKLFTEDPIQYDAIQIALDLLKKGKNISLDNDVLDTKEQLTDKSFLVKEKNKYKDIYSILEEPLNTDPYLIRSLSELDCITCQVWNVLDDRSDFKKMKTDRQALVNQYKNKIKMIK